MPLPTLNIWLRLIISLHAFFSFFMGVFFLAWGDQITSPPWRVVFSIPGGHTTWGVILSVAGGLFLLGLGSSTGRWSRRVAGLVSGCTYFAIGVFLAIAPFVQSNSLNASVGIWMLGGLVALSLTGLMESLPEEAFVVGRRE